MTTQYRLCSQISGHFCFTIKYIPGDLWHIFLNNFTALIVADNVSVELIESVNELDLNILLLKNMCRKTRNKENAATMLER